jgi:predicted DNA-binding transcriptional regulator YafY
MNRFDRLFGILLHLRQGRIVSASDLAAAFEVSPRTIYRDVETLSALGIPVYAERGRDGGFGLIEGYFLPPIMFTREEAVSLVIALVLLHSLRARPFDAALATAHDKLLAAVPDALRNLLADAHRLIGFEQTPPDMFHEPPAEQDEEDQGIQEGAFVTAFVQALLDQMGVLLRYNSPYSSGEKEYRAVPLGVLWDRGHWYLVGSAVGDTKRGATRLWRSDRVLALRVDQVRESPARLFDVRDLLGRSWLREAMETWIEASPVVLRISCAQAAKLRADWYYRYARFEEAGPDAVTMTFGEGRPSVVFELVRWLGPGAELVAPAAWRDLLRDELEQMVSTYKTAP